MKTVDLPVAMREGEAFELAKATYQNEIPGFQDNRLHDAPRSHHLGLLNGLIDEVEEAAQAATGEPVPFTYYPFMWNEPGQYAPHIDGGFRGLAIHKNGGSNGGFVDLAHPAHMIEPGREGQVFLKEGEKYNSYKGIGFAGLQDVIQGPVYRGPLVEKGLTIFSEGNMGGLLPTIHHFQRPFSEHYLRLGSDIDDGKLSNDELTSAVREFRRHLISSDMSDMFMDLIDANIEHDHEAAGHLTAALLKHPNSLYKTASPEKASWRERRKFRAGVRNRLSEMQARQAERDGQRS